MLPAEPPVEFIFLSETREEKEQKALAKYAHLPIDGTVTITHRRNEQDLQGHARVFTHTGFGEFIKSEEGPVVDGLRQGEWTRFYKNGAIEEKRKYLNDVLDGPCRSYHRNGKRKKECCFVSGLEEGPWNERNDKGALKCEGNYKKGNLHGDYKEYHPNNAGISLVANYEDGEQTVEQKHFYPGTGRIKAEGPFDKKQGEHGLWKYYSPAGTLEKLVFNNQRGDDDIKLTNQMNRCLFWLQQGDMLRKKLRLSSRTTPQIAQAQLNEIEKQYSQQLKLTM